MFNPIATVWFWFMVIGGLGIIAAIIAFEICGEASDRSNTTPAWIWVVFSICLLLFFISFILFCVWKEKYYHFVKMCKCKALEEKGETCDECDMYNLKMKKGCEKIKGKGCVPEKKVTVEENEEEDFALPIGD